MIGLFIAVMSVIAIIIISIIIYAYTNSQFHEDLKFHNRIVKREYHINGEYIPICMSFKRFMKIYPVIKDNTDLRSGGPKYVSSNNKVFRIVFPSSIDFLRYYYMWKNAKKIEERSRKLLDAQIDMKVFLQEIQNDINEYIQRNVIEDTSENIKNINKKSKIYDICEVQKILDGSSEDDIGVL